MLPERPPHLPPSPSRGRCLGCGLGLSRLARASLGSPAGAGERSPLTAYLGLASPGRCAMSCRPRAAAVPGQAAWPLCRETPGFLNRSLQRAGALHVATTCVEKP